MKKIANKSIPLFQLEQSHLEAGTAVWSTRT